VNLVRLVLRNVARRPARSGLLLLFAALSVFLLVFLRTIVTSLRSGVQSAAPDRLMVQSGIGPFAELPSSYHAALRAVDGARSVARWSWFGGTYRDPSNFFAIMAVDLDVVLEQYPEIEVPPAQVRDLLADRRGCLVGAALAEEHGWRLGDAVPIQGTVFPLEDGRAWEFTIRAVYRSGRAGFPEKVLLFHWDHLEETRRTLSYAAESAALVTAYSVKVAPGRRPADVAVAIDARWAGGPVRTLTQTEKMHVAEEVGLLGELLSYLGIVGGVVVLATLLSAGNAMGIAAGERRREAGILLALGFPDHVVGSLVVSESLLLVGLGAALGTAAAAAVAPLLRDALDYAAYVVEPETVLAGLGTGLMTGFLGALWPAVRLARVRPVEVFREEV
jgi:putative ABC transport system permease protein